MPFTVQLLPPGKENTPENFIPLRTIDGEKKVFGKFDQAMSHLKSKGYFDEADCEIIELPDPPVVEEEE